MDPWQLWQLWSTITRMPLSGDVWQDYRPVTTWFSPRIDLYAGNQQIESEVVGNVASFGRQLGILCDALLEVSQKVNADGGDKMKKLREIADDIENVKRRYRGSLQTEARDLLDKLANTDRPALEALLQHYNGILQH